MRFVALIALLSLLPILGHAQQPVELDISTATASDYEVRWITADGETYWLDMSADLVTWTHRYRSARGRIDGHLRLQRSKRTRVPTIRRRHHRSE